MRKFRLCFPSPNEGTFEGGWNFLCLNRDILYDLSTSENIPSSKKGVYQKLKFFIASTTFYSFSFSPSVLLPRVDPEVQIFSSPNRVVYRIEFN